MKRYILTYWSERAETAWTVSETFFSEAAMRLREKSVRRREEVFDVEVGAYWKPAHEEAAR